MLPSVFLPTVAILASWCFGRISGQNANCEMQYPQTTYQYTLCQIGGYMFPTNFDVKKVDPSTVNLYVSQNGTTGNLVTVDYVPFPDYPNMTLVYLANFNLQPNDPRFPLNGLFANVKYHIQTLQLNSVKLLSLNASDFSGFNKLQNLYLSSVYLTAVDVATFSQLGRLVVDGPVSSAYQSPLNNLLIQSNPGLTALDWSFLAPLASNITQIQISYNGLTSMNFTASIPFILRQAQLIYLSGNRLTQLPAAIYKTFNTSFSPDYPAVYLSNNPICTQYTYCSCCDMFEFAKYMVQVNHTGMVKDITCGNSSQPNFSQQMSNPTFFTKIDQCQQCSAAGDQFCDSLTTTAPACATQPSVWSSTSPPSAVLPVDSQFAIRINCLKTNVTFSQMEFNDTDALVAVLTVDNTFKCRTLMHAAHVWLETKIQSIMGRTTSGPLTTLAPTGARGTTTVQPRGKRDLQTSFRPATTVYCQRGNLTLSDDYPELSEAIQLTFITTGSLSCRVLFGGFLNYLFGMR